jgi:hypothetical protein
VNPFIIICFFTFVIHVTESLAYCMRLAGVRTKQIAIAMSFVTSTLLISRLSNMFQAPLLGAAVDGAIHAGTDAALNGLEIHFRIVIMSAFFGSLVGAVLGPTFVRLFELGIRNFLHGGSVPRLLLKLFLPRTWKVIVQNFRLPSPKMLSNISLKRLPKQFLIINIFVTSIFTIGVLCSLYAGAHIPHLRSTASQLSGIVNGIATILFTMFVDPSGARITDQATHGTREEADVKSVVFFLQLGRLFGILVVSQIFFKPFSLYIMWITKLLGHAFV